MNFTLVGKHEKDARANRDGYVDAMLGVMEQDKTISHIDCDLMGCINSGKLLNPSPTGRLTRVLP